ncbi:unnamed protein product [Bursaphelenchus xylophilus]|uniref:(pine wood nematode) hypothetical protein n=1 Tax=Bursaphelenchus xylophilus TaxID=6326 RepID=A0A7I8X6C3_BURXY|nr:unnamed protein product [Bursaphelenchus xylophilus]CAG9123293.1 unnamed protein product [Bursaphelenchus xylophilus]
MLFFLLFLLIYSSSSNVFYVDDVSKQSLPFILDLQQAQLFQNQILILLGLEKPVKGINSSDKIVSTFMSSLYKVTESSEDPIFMFDSHKLEEEIYASDTIMGFVPHNVTILTVNGVSVTEITFIIEKDQSLEIFAGTFYLVLEGDLMQIEDVAMHYTHQGLHYCTRRSLKGDFDEEVNFASFNGTNLFTEWLENVNGTYKITLELLDYETSEKDLSNIHFFGVGFFFSDGPVNSRPKRNVNLENQPDLSRRPEAESGFIPMTSSLGKKPGRCVLKSLFVDFKDLGWDNWVIAPSGYQADFCEGDCNFPLYEDLFPSNHAIVQSLIHLVDDKSTEMAKCAATEMREQSILFMNNQDNIVMKKYQNMRVNRCGCR